MEYLKLRVKVFACRYQNLVIKLLEDGDELYGLFQPVIESIKLKLDFICAPNTIVLPLVITLIVLVFWFVIRNR